MNIQYSILKNIKKTIIENNINISYINDIHITSQSKIGHYQINGIIKISKLLKIDIIELSKKIIFQLQNKKKYKKIQYSHPGFINIFLNTTWLSKKIQNMIFCKTLGIKKNKKKNIVIDYSSPNMAKEMHIGHLRSTIIGDTMARIMTFLGYNVIRINHIGDWGIQFGMLIAFIKKYYPHIQDINFSLKNLEMFYQKSKKLYDHNKNFKKQAIQYFLNLQNQKKKYLKIWKKMVNITIDNNNKIYKLLNVTLRNKHIQGESFFINLIPAMLQDLKKKKITTEYQGNILVYLDEIQNKHGKPMGVILQKKDSRFLYSTIDLACLIYRINILQAERIIYYTDVRQTQHLKQVKMIAQKAKYIPQDFQFHHYTFGMILSKNNKPFQTRSGKLIKLNILIKKSIQQAKIIIKKKNKNFRKKKISYLSTLIGISAIKYFDLSKNRKKNYIFNWNKILSLKENTALYIQYTYTRIQSILKKSKINPYKIKSNIILKNNIEIQLSIKLLEFEKILHDINNKGTPHLLCLYLFQISSLFSKFYEKYSIIYAKIIKIKYSRLKLSFLTSKIIKIGLNLLGIKTLKYM